MEDALAQSNQEFIEPKSAKKPKIDSVENEVGKRAQLFTCVECPSEFNSKELLADHIIQTHTKVKCKLCSKDYDILALKKHYSEDHLAKTFVCDKCEKTFVTQDLLKKHQTEKHELFCVCGICKQGFQSMKELGEHFESHELQPNSLEKIHNKPFEQKSKNTKKAIAKKTIQSTNTPRKMSKEYACGSCDRSFKLADNLSYHIELAHETHKCYVCNKGFTKEIGLQIHLTKEIGDLQKVRSSKEGNKCDFCSRRFVSSCGKTAHLKNCPKKLTNSGKSMNKQFRKKIDDTDDSTK